MINAWSLLWEELTGTMDETYPVKDYVDGHGDVHSTPVDDVYAYHYPPTSPLSDDPYPTVGALEYYKRPDLVQDIDLSDNDDQAAHHFGDVDPVYAHHFPGKPQPDLKNGSIQKYQEDKGISDLKSYVASTYKGHYTNQGSNVQTLDLIHSVGDAESFCRSNAIKYLSRYDKKGSAKNDILKAMHYCLLLYYFSGNTLEPDYTNTRYETF